MKENNTENPIPAGLNPSVCDPQERAETEKAFGRLYDIVKTLRAPGGCPWDRAQTPETMRTDLVEEAFEAVDAINEKKSDHVCEELGDVFLNASMISYMYEQKGDFTLAKSLNEVSDKIIRRHPHVWPESEGKANALEGGAKTADQVLTQWDAIKRGVEGRAGKSVLDEVSKGLPPLMQAYKLGKKAAKKGFDWKDDDMKGLWGKIDEEKAELIQAYEENPEKDENGKASSHVEEEFGDVLFCLVNLARHLGVDPVVAMERANTKFRNRFGYVEAKMAELGREFKKGQWTEVEDKLWKEAKKLEKE
ncbi:MAG: nucleoside triphosphate pyrophosphohydrolase [Treponemataceae bacterium]|nr:nucleoside triphosphate pyrophosphohydrolase [Treponemataceae bacterium]